MKIRTAGEQQMIFFCHCPEIFFIGTLVAGIYCLNAVQTCSHKFFDHGGQLCTLHFIKAWMCENCQSAGLMDQSHCLHRCDFIAVHIAFATVADVFVKHGFQIFYLSGIHQISCNVWTCDHGSRIQTIQIFCGDPESLFLKFFYHFQIAVVPVITEFCKFCLKFGIGRIDKESDDMDFCFVVFCGKFHTRDNFEPGGFAGSKCFGNTVNGIMVG